MSCPDTYHQAMQEESSTSYRALSWSRSIAHGSFPAAPNVSQLLNGAGTRHEMLVDPEPAGYHSTWTETGESAHKSGSRDDRARVVAKKQAACHLCHKPMLKRVLQRHLRTVHSKPREDCKYLCTLCNHSFARNDILDRHQAEQHGDGSPLVECISCGSLIRQRALDEHYKTRKCQQIQLHNDVMQIRTLTNLNLTPHIDPLLAVLVSNIKQSKYLWAILSGSANDYDDHVDFLHFRGIALRSVFRTLTASTSNEIEGLCIALYGLMVPEDSAMFRGQNPMEGQNRILIGTIHALRGRFRHHTLAPDLEAPCELNAELMNHLIPLEFKERSGLLTTRNYWPDIFRPHVLGLEFSKWKFEGTVWYSEKAGSVTCCWVGDASSFLVLLSQSAV